MKYTFIMVKYINIQFYRINVLGVNCPGSNVGGQF